MPAAGLYDMHCHILPEVDDGSRSMEESLKILEMEYNDGVTHILLTPHFRYDMFETPLEKIREQYAALTAKVGERWPDMDLRLGCELHRSLDMAECLQEGKRLTLNGSRYVLLEFSGRDPRSMIFDRTRDLLNAGYIPILAHVERYPPLHDNPGLLAELKDMGAYLQVNVDTISGKDGIRQKWFARKLMKKDLIDFVGSDAHRSDTRIPGIKKAWDCTLKTMGQEYAHRLFIDHPSRLFSEA